MPAIINSVVPRFIYRAAAPSAKWLQYGIVRVIESATFHEKDFTLTKHDRARISSMLNDLLQDRLITNDIKQTRE